MIKTRLIRLLQHARKYIVLQVLWQWLSLVAQIVIITMVSKVIAAAWSRDIPQGVLIKIGLIVGACIIVRVILDKLYTMAGHYASIDVKRILREKIYNKLLMLGSSYREYIASAEVLQMANEGVEQLEVYFGRYLSQFFYAFIAPITLFAVLMHVSIRASIILLVAVPLIPIVIMIVMKIANALLEKYFTVYYGLGDTFLEKLHGLTTLKIYEADEQAAIEMDEEAETFRKVTMKVLSMQLNSTMIMDIVAYGGSAIGIIVALSEFSHGEISISGVVMIVLLSAEFFLPMRLLGSLFHIGMNGMKASDRIFAFLDLEEDGSRNKAIEQKFHKITIKKLRFSYDGQNDVLKDITLDVARNQFVSIVGVSGSGKSTIAKVLAGINRQYSGSVQMNDVELRGITDASLMNYVTLVSNGSYVFAESVRDNLLMGNPDALDEELIAVLQQMKLWEMLKVRDGLDTQLSEAGTDLSGGQRQRLALARALLHDTPIYILDEATSNIDMESEEIIMQSIRQLAKEKAVLLISHRLANVVDSDEIILLKDGMVKERGTHYELIQAQGAYANLYQQQTDLEAYANRFVQEAEGIQKEGAQS